MDIFFNSREQKERENYNRLVNKIRYNWQNSFLKSIKSALILAD